jgi:hypothetical protein
VRVLSLGPQPQLEVIGASSSVDTTVSQAMRERLPQQNGYAPLLATLGALAQWPMLRQLPPYLRTALALLEHTMSSPQELSQGEGLRQAIARSGLFLEAQLADPDADDASIGQDDFKGALLRLMAMLHGQLDDKAGSDADVPPPLAYRNLNAQARLGLPDELAQSNEAADLLPRLRSDVEAALARLEVAQLEAGRAGPWLIEIPVHGKDGHDVLQLRLAYQNDEEPSESHWTLGFALDLPDLGPVHGELHLRGMHLAVRLWAQRSDSAARLEAQFNGLRQQLATHGLSLDQLSCQTGLPQASGSHSAVFLKATA